VVCRSEYGFYSTATTPQHGFIRDPTGNTVTFRAPNAGPSNFQGTNPVSINNAGVITGDYIDARGQTHAFVRSVPSRPDPRSYMLLSDNLPHSLVAC
jgi:hypothetical protein